MPMLCKNRIGCFGTSCFQKGGWPPANIRETTTEKCNFNYFYHCIDQHGTLLGRWMDNELVFCISTIHRPGQVIRKNRKRPRMTVLNKRHVQSIFGTEGKKQIYIPTLINDYNCKMGGVDVADQRIAYYQPNVQCRRNLIPMFIQSLGIIQSNLYIVHKSYYEQMGNTKKSCKRTNSFPSI